MGNRNKKSAVTAVSTTTEGQPVAVLGVGRKTIVLTLDDGTTEKRIDYIRRRADEGLKRADIAKELTVLQGKPIAYQIVFAATKNHPAYAKRADAVETEELEELEEIEETEAHEDAEEVDGLA